MANGPIQVVLNTNNFISSWERTPGGSHKDFYEGKDSEFKIHRSKISSQLEALKNKLNENQYSEMSYAKIKLKPSALAKSHRPTSSLFKSDVAPVVGAGELGELIVEIAPKAIEKIVSKIAHTEDETRYKTDKYGNEVSNPSIARSELGAIDEIRLYIESDKRKFSIKDGLEWLSNPKTGGVYIIELFQTPPPRQDWDNLPPARYNLIRSFYEGLLSLGQGITVFSLNESNKFGFLLGLRINQNESAPVVQFTPIRSHFKKLDRRGAISMDIGRHTEIIGFLDKHPLVKKIMLPPIISKSQASTASAIGTSCQIPSFDSQKVYPKLGIVDGGVSKILHDWIGGQYGFIHNSHRDEDHGTFIAGLAIAGNSLNSSEVCKEDDGCEIIDIDILPEESVFDQYYTNPLAFFDVLEDAVVSMKAQTGVRIFNFSLNFEEHVSTNYSLAAQRLDKIAEDNDVVFVISAGNTLPGNFRKEWPSDPVAALSILAASSNDNLRTPAESSRNLSVAALNPPNFAGIEPYALSNYSCIGRGNKFGLKPDFGHVGGSGTKLLNYGHCLFSISPSGSIVDNCGTSFSTPIVAKTLGSIESSIEGEMSRETLSALAIHHSVIPAIFKRNELKDIVKHIVGFGIPMGAQEILIGNDHTITLVFANRIHSGTKMSFQFSWPSVLMKNNKCFGYAKLTLVSTPPFDYNYGSEFVRVNIAAHLRQEQKDGKYIGRLDPIYLPEGTEDPLYEKNQIAHSFKWSPVKVYEKYFRGVGPSSNWKLEVDYLTRDGESMPAEGVPFTAILTIADPTEKAPVFTNMRQTIQSLGVSLSDIRTAARVVSRI